MSSGADGAGPRPDPHDVRRWVTAIEYQGTAYAGWQCQHHAVTVQAMCQRALSGIADGPVEVVAAGRTDAGVHAFNQVAHFDSAAHRNARSWLLGANSRLPADISLRWVMPAFEGFHARHSAVARTYRYLVHNSAARSALLEKRACWVRRELDVDAMQRGAAFLVGEHDFSAFRDGECQSRSPQRQVHALRIFRQRELICFEIRANAFLHHMCRNIVGTLFEVGLGRRPIEWVGDVLDSRQRTSAGTNAPACGLYFVNVEYPSRYRVPSPPEFWLP